VTAAGVPVVKCKGPVESVEVEAVVDPTFRVYIIPAAESPGAVAVRELSAASVKALRSIVNL
jgi:hypothetical protein